MLIRTALFSAIAAAGIHLVTGAPVDAESPTITVEVGDIVGAAAESPIDIAASLIATSPCKYDPC
jgi:hypothetical protein